MSKRALKRMQIHDLIDLKVDYAFKQLFGSERNKKITVVFLNAILHRTGRNTIKEIFFAKQEVGGHFLEDKQSRLDIVVRTQGNELINIEIQLSNDHDMIKRTLFYWSHMYIEQLKKSEGYYQLVPTITINICNFTVFPKSNQYHSSYHLYEDQTKERIATGEEDVLEIHFIEMNKFLKQWNEGFLSGVDDVLARWLLLLGMVDGRKDKVYEKIYQELEELAMNDENLLEAFNVWEELSDNPSTREAYRARLKYILDEEAKMSDVRHKGRLEGKIERDLEIILSGVQNNVPIEMLALLTGYSIDKINKMIEEYQLSSD